MSNRNETSPAVPAESVIGKRGKSAGEWQPIETAPLKEDVLAYVPRRRAGPMICVAHNHTGKQWWAKFGNGAVAPSHWMPLPEPPK